ncbi:MAG TPA: hypothetical protein VIJ51_04525 [Solirubrobacteraceae bacterium]
MRGALRTAALAGSALALPGALTGCATYIEPEPRIPGYYLSIGTLPAGLTALVAKRAARIGIAPPLVVPNDGGGLTGLTAEDPLAGPFDPVYDQYQRGTDLVVISGGADEAVARTVTAQGVQIVTYLAPLRYQNAQITLAPGALASLLAADAVSWARTRLRGPARAMFYTGISPSGSPNWVGEGRPNPAVLVPDEQAVRAEFRVLPKVEVMVADAPSGESVGGLDLFGDPAGYLRAYPGLRIVICASDLDAVTIAQALRRQLSPAQRADIYVGGLGTPNIGLSLFPSGPGSQLANEDVSLVEPGLRELRRDDVLRALATVRLRDIADAVTGVPAALMRGHPGFNVALSPVLLKPGSAALLDYARDSHATLPPAAG